MPKAVLFATAIAWIGTCSPLQSEDLSDRIDIDAQIARGVVASTVQEGTDRPIQQSIHALIVDADRNCLRIDQNAIGEIRGATVAQAGLRAALDVISQSKTGAWLVQTAIARNVTFCLDRTTVLEAHYRSHLRLLGLSTRLNPAGMVVFLAHELAHVPQHPRFSNNRRFSPSDMILLQRVREAAAEAVATRVLWQLHQKGIKAPWQEKLTTAYHDIAERFQIAMAGRKGEVQELWATRSAFHHWFAADWRLEIYDDLMMKTLARIAVDPLGLIPPSRRLSDHYLRSIADYGGDLFLMDGDGQALIRNFQDRGLSAETRNRLDAIQAHAPTATTAFPAELPGETLSAVSPGPIPAD